MYREELTQHSRHLDRDMHMMIYGHDGMPLLAFPTQDSMCHNLEDFGMIAELSDFLEDGRIRIFVVDTVDRESWSPGDPDNSRRAARQEQYYRYISEEAVPFILERTGGRLPVATGMSLGANHALILFLRRPDLFDGVLALSGVYDSDVFFGGWMDETLYMSSPERFLPNLPADHPYINLYNERRLILSAKELLTEAHLHRRSENMKSLAVGSIVEGTVETLKEYGAFVDIGNDMSGLLHISQITDKRIKHPKIVLQEGQKVTVMITKIEDGKISLSMTAVNDAKAREVEEEAAEYKSEYIPNNPFAALLKGIKLDDK